MNWKRLAIGFILTLGIALALAWLLGEDAMMKIIVFGLFLRSINQTLRDIE